SPSYAVTSKMIRASKSSPSRELVIALLPVKGNIICRPEEKFYLYEKADEISKPRFPVHRGADNGSLVYQTRLRRFYGLSRRAGIGFEWPARGGLYGWFSLQSGESDAFSSPGKTRGG